MTNKEKYAEKILAIACSSAFAVSKESNNPIACNSFPCIHCRFHKKNASCFGSRIEWLNQEYTEPPVNWSKVDVDTPILVRDRESGEWMKRHFAEYKFSVVYTWNEGRTSWSADENDMTSWKYAKLAESEE